MSAVRAVEVVAMLAVAPRRCSSATHPRRKNGADLGVGPIGRCEKVRWVVVAGGRVDGVKHVATLKLRAMFTRQAGAPRGAVVIWAGRQTMKPEFGALAGPTRHMLRIRRVHYVIGQRSVRGVSGRAGVQQDGESCGVVLVVAGARSRGWRPVRPGQHGVDDAVQIAAGRRFPGQQDGLQDQGRANTGSQWTQHRRVEFTGVHPVA
jgi:hypothetical protein